MSAAGSRTLLSREQWSTATKLHAERADALTAAHRTRAARREPHPVWDFLFTYYSAKPAVLRRWHPGAGVVLTTAAQAPHASWRWYVLDAATGEVALDVPSMLVDRAAGVAQAVTMLQRTLERPPRFSCFGLHEWAMAYRKEEHRHAVPLRLGQRGTDALVEASELRCTHFDAFRFFTTAAAPRNAVHLTRADQARLEQPGCLHAGMDIYKWAIKLGPLVPGTLLLDAFELARDIRQLDMEASPYDLRAWGFSPVAIETTEGKAIYVQRQREFTARAQSLRAAMLAAIVPALERAGSQPAVVNAGS